LGSICAEFTLHCASELAPNKNPELRPSTFTVTRGRRMIALRDQHALKQGHVELTGGWHLQDLVAAINRRVFFWPGCQRGPIGYGERLFEAYSWSDQIVLPRRVFGVAASQPG
jgi:hypothetical protein